MEGQNQNDELYPIAVLIDELKVWEDGSNASVITLRVSAA